MANVNGRNPETKTAVLKTIENDGYLFGKSKLARGEVLTHIFDAVSNGSLKYVVPLKGAAAADQKTDVKDAFASFKAGDEKATDGKGTGSAKTMLNWFNSIAFYAHDGKDAANVVAKANKLRDARLNKDEKAVDVARMLLALASTHKSNKLKRALNSDEIEAAVVGEGGSGPTLLRALSSKKTGVIALANEALSDDVSKAKADALKSLVKAAQDVLVFLDAEKKLEKNGAVNVDDTMETFVSMGLMKRMANGSYKPV